MILLNAKAAASSEAPQVAWSVVSFLTNKFSLTGAPFFALIIGAVLLCMAIPYVLGSLNFAIIFSRLFFHDDIRKYGSGNAGATNMLRTYGKGPAAATMILDMLKCVVSVFIGWLLLPVQAELVPDSATFAYSFEPGFLAGFACILGHIFPCFYKFKGGKGVSSVAMLIVCTSPVVALILFVCFVVIVAGTKFVSLASVMCMALYPIFLNALPFGFPFGAKGFPVIISIITAALIIFMHRENIKRIYNGTESKISFSKKSKEDKETKSNEQ